MRRATRLEASLFHCGIGGSTRNLQAKAIVCFEPRDHCISWEGNRCDSSSCWKRCIHGAIITLYSTISSDKNQVRIVRPSSTGDGGTKNAQDVRYLVPWQQIDVPKAICLIHDSYEDRMKKNRETPDELYSKSSVPYVRHQAEISSNRLKVIPHSFTKGRVNLKSVYTDGIQTLVTEH